MEEYRYPWEINKDPYSEEEILKKQLRRQANIQGGALLIYKAIMNAAVIALGSIASLFAVFLATFAGILNGTEDPDLAAWTEEFIASTMDWGYLLAVTVGFVILLLWKKPRYFRETILQKGEQMTVGRFLSLMCLVLGCQLPTQFLVYGLDWLSSLLGGSLMEVLEQSAADTDSVPMWLYVCLAAPIAEEVLFRGLLLRSLEPYGKNFAIVVSAVLFGLFHGNPVQTPFAILVGLVLGYVAIHYHVLWAIVLHMINNLLMGDLLPRLLGVLPYGLGDLLTWILLGTFFLAALLVLLVKWRFVAEKCAEEQVLPWQKNAFWGAACVVILCVLCSIDIVAFLVMMFL